MSTHEKLFAAKRRRARCGVDTGYFAGSCQSSSNVESG